MTNVAVVLTSLFLLAGCGKTGQSLQQPPVKYRGSWANDGAEAANASAKLIDTDVTPVDEGDECKDIQAKGGAVDAGIMNIDQFGNVFSAKKITDTNTSYIRIGKIKQDGLFIHEPGADGEYVSGYSKLASGTVSVQPLVYLKVSEDKKAISMEIKVVTNSAAGLYVSDVLETRNFRKITEVEEKSLIARALTCLALSKPMEAGL